MRCSPGFSFSASLNFRMSSSKMVPIVKLSIAYAPDEADDLAVVHGSAGPNVALFARSESDAEPLSPAGTMDHTYE